MNFFELAWSILPKLLEGTMVTIELTIISILIGIFTGVPVALGRVYGNKTIYLITTFFVEIIRGTPLLTQLFILYFGLPSIGIMLSPIMAAIIGMGINSRVFQRCNSSCKKGTGCCSSFYRYESDPGHSICCFASNVTFSHSILVK